MIYLDYSANTPVDPAVLEVFVRTEQDYIGNPNSAHPAGTSAKDRLAEATETIAGLLYVETSEIIYTSGASEANNLAVKGIARARRNYGKHIISTALEHPSVSGPLTWLQEQGYEIDLADIDRNGRIDTQHLKELLRDDKVTCGLILEVSITISEGFSASLHSGKYCSDSPRTWACLEEAVQ